MRRLVAALLMCSLFVLTPAYASWSSVSERVLASVGRVTMGALQENNTLALGDCTAWSINQPNHLYATAGHCNGIEVKVDGHPSGIVLMDEVADVMVLQVPELSQPALKPSTRKVVMGLEAGAYGYGYGWAQPFFKQGQVSIPLFVSPNFGNRKLTIVNFAFIAGMSGGPLVDQDGRVVSMVQQSNSDGQAGNGATLDVLRAVLEPYWDIR